MPILNAYDRKTHKYYYSWGKNGKKYYYSNNNNMTKIIAYKKALNQGRAIHSNRKK